MPLILAAIYLAFMGAVGLKARKAEFHPPVPFTQEYWDANKDAR